jgi:hypothetical protein
MVGMMGVARARAAVLMMRRASFMVKVLIDILGYCGLVVEDDKERRGRSDLGWLLITCRVRAEGVVTSALPEWRMVSSWYFNAGVEVKNTDVGGNTAEQKLLVDPKSIL